MKECLEAALSDGGKEACFNVLQNETANGFLLRLKEKMG